MSTTATRLNTDPYSDDYCTGANKLRILNDGANELPWQLDGVIYDEQGYIRLCTDAVMNFTTHAEAIAAIPTFLMDLEWFGIEPAPTT